MAITLIDFWAPWCPPCKLMNPIIEELEEDLKGQLEFSKINVDEDPGAAQKYSVMSIPTYVIEKDGEEAARTTGARSKEEFQKWIEGQL